MCPWPFTRAIANTHSIVSCIASCNESGSWQDQLSGLWGTLSRMSPSFRSNLLVNRTNLASRILSEPRLMKCFVVIDWECQRTKRTDPYPSNNTKPRPVTHWPSVFGDADSLSSSSQFHPRRAGDRPAIWNACRQNVNHRLLEVVFYLNVQLSRGSPPSFGRSHGRTELISGPQDRTAFPNRNPGCPS
jgi:hypothetical protein